MNLGEARVSGSRHHNQIWPITSYKPKGSNTYQVMDLKITDDGLVFLLDEVLELWEYVGPNTAETHEKVRMERERQTKRVTGDDNAD